MTRLNLNSSHDEKFKASIEKESGQNVSLCYQCGKCTAGCPLAFAMDITPRQMMRMVQLGLRQEAIQAGSTSICVVCNTCSVRCPREIETARVMEAVRIEGINSGQKPPEKEVALFNKLFLESIRSNGRIFEFGLIGQNNLRSGRLFKDAAMAPKLLLSGKLKLLPSRIKGRDNIKKIFANIKQMEADTQ